MKKNFWEKVNEWFTISRVLITFWNGIFLLYHILIIGINSWTSIVMQITALIIEYLVSGLYEKLLMWSNKKINKRTEELGWIARILVNVFIKSLIFIVIFSIIYNTTYYMRLQFFYLIDWGVDLAKLNQSIINMLWFTPVAGTLMGFIVLRRKKRKREIAEKKRHKAQMKFGPFAWR